MTEPKVTQYLTLGGSVVVVEEERKWSGRDETRYYDWLCRGCGRSDSRALTDKFAIEHAKECRAVPLSQDAAAPPSASAVLIAEALREVARALETTSRRPRWRGGAR